MLTTVDTANTTMAAMSTLRRPYLSLSGPKNTCPRARPSMLVASPICTSEGVVWNIRAMEGSVGRYISVTNGPKAESIPRNTIRNT